MFSRKLLYVFTNTIEDHNCFTANHIKWINDIMVAINLLLIYGIRYLNQHLFSQWLVACWIPGHHYLDQSQLFKQLHYRSQSPVDIESTWKKFFDKQMGFKIPFMKRSQIYPDFYMSTQIINRPSLSDTFIRNTLFGTHHWRLMKK